MSKTCEFLAIFCFLVNLGLTVGEFAENGQGGAVGGVGCRAKVSRFGGLGGGIPGFNSPKLLLIDKVSQNNETGAWQ